MKKYIKYLFLLLPVILMAACIEEYRLDETTPPDQAARFSFQPSPENDNIINFTAEQEFFLMKWDLGNGASGTGKTVTGIYPSAGTYNVTLTIFDRGGSASTTLEVVIEQTDPTLLDRPIYNLLTGGIDAIEGKTWVVDSARSGHFGVGPDPVGAAGYFPEWYQAQANEKVGSGMYTDRYTFFLRDFEFDWETNGFVYLNGAQGSNFPGSFDPGVGDLSAPFNSPGGLTWNIVEEEGEFPVLNLTSPGSLGYYAGTNSFQIIRLEENEMFIRFIDQANAGLAWYVRLIPAGFDSGAGNPDPDPDTGGNVAFTLQDLIGSGEKAWKLKPAAGAFGVGPNPGSDQFYPNGNDISGERPCLFNDLFIFKDGEVFEYDAQGDIFGESYMGLAEEQCQPASNLTGTTGEAWGPGVHTFSFTEGTATENPKITVTGTGAFIALPKAYNGGEYTAGPPATNRSVTYDVIGFTNEAGNEELTISIDITNNGGVFWTFVLIPDDI